MLNGERATATAATAAAAGGGGGYVIDRLVYPQIKIEDDDDDDDHYFDVRTPVAAAAPLPQLAPPLRTVSSFIPHQHQPHHHEDEGNSTIDEMYSIYYV